VKTDDAHLNDQRAPAQTAGVTSATFSQACLPLAGGNVTGQLNAHARLSMRGLKAESSPATAGCCLGIDSGDLIKRANGSLWEPREARSRKA
jgi:hypothetical protein